MNESNNIDSCIQTIPEKINHFIYFHKTFNIEESYYTIPYHSYLVILFEMYKIKYKREKGDLYFECTSLQTLKEYINNNGNLKYRKLIKLIYDTGILIKNLEEDKQGIFCFSLDD